MKNKSNLLIIILLILIIILTTSIFLIKTNKSKSQENLQISSIVEQVNIENNTYVNIAQPGEIIKEPEEQTNTNQTSNVKQENKQEESTKTVQTEEQTVDKNTQQNQQQEETTTKQTVTATQIIYGTSSQGRNLEAYLIKGIGNNSKTIFLDFEVHRL